MPQQSEVLLVATANSDMWVHVGLWQESEKHLYDLQDFKASSFWNYTTQ